MFEESQSLKLQTRYLNNVGNYDVLRKIKKEKGKIINNKSVAEYCH